MKMPDEFIPVAAPALVGNERKYVLDCIDTGWISSSGEYVTRFEAALAEFFGVKHAIVCCNGTVALHLALMALGIGAGDEVIVPTATFVASANAVRYTGAAPVLVDCDRESWQIDPERVREAITPNTRAIMAVHLYGHPAPMEELMSIARDHKLHVIEDAAESHGARYRGRRVGGMGDVGTLSFYGNKIIACGEGGAVLTNSIRTAEHTRLLRGQGQDPARRYWFIEMGYNYRMTNIQAAIGLGQIENANWHLERRRDIAQIYSEMIGRKIPDLQQQVEQPWAQSAHWMNTFILPKDFGLTLDEAILGLSKRRIESRPFFPPLHRLPIYSEQPGPPCPVAEELASRGISLPSSSMLTHDEIGYIVDSLATLRKP